MAKIITLLSPQWFLALAVAACDSMRRNRETFRDNGNYIWLVFSVLFHLVIVIMAMVFKRYNST